ncbi:MAG: acyl carrier protein [Bacteroidetes bacterium]|jgi:acyl carrier protein|nr:acyl carrier protein [Bacteroidota bacterium]
MTNEEKVALIEETLDIENGSLRPETELSSVAEFDSMAKLSLIVLCDENFNKKLTGEQIRAFVTVGDILEFLG